jgi:TPR repeat protein
MYYQGKGVPQDYAEAVRWYVFYSVNGLLVGMSIASATALALPARKD